MESSAERDGDTDRDDGVGTRERIIRAASRLMQRQGYDGTGIKQIAQEAGAALASVYHFFPGGKKELAVAAIQRGEEEFADELRVAFDQEEDPAEAIVLCTRRLAEGLRASDWVDGCPVTSTALGSASRADDIQRAAASAFAHWRDLVLDRLLRAGVDADAAHDLAHTVISTLEGAELAAQVSRDATPLHAAGRHLAQLIRLAQGTPARS
ncbi:transcriptional regulator, TetR family [Streptoalloteichus tenebrarius]|uniref:Transcriptional regulator, TetR family n=1 Tax=Streptoalloteichus tenebrarius (strain ATCC 17920 / DSM 40477 / JCM 4838 / CBS 697.72 / NBRC 16177 / NCIMB 11028 / NRRL B-12390 / A12253. 1 / ISP 5477) TaxID=1933 RepID=A0ABT1HVC5_STRSD|nr:TetR/AcrR family transcriptional regulator [Streptoalloteichus tenebrarius]MCP2259446.1 transcriptional regulator, TetR family [Streptoalloteichus tenebrarius]BFF02388.1 TetR/AcrR family transcriptional regulator [Streptoalloteichus tenebrarius]